VKILIQRAKIEEVEEDEWTLATQNILEGREQILEKIKETEEVCEDIQNDYDSLIISYLRGEIDEEMDEVWINAKTLNSQEFALKYDTPALEEGQIPPNTTNMWMFSTKRLPIDSLNCALGTTR